MIDYVFKTIIRKWKMTILVCFVQLVRRTWSLVCINDLQSLGVMWSRLLNRAIPIVSEFNRVKFITEKIPFDLFCFTPRH